ncbi:MAG TPA: rhamnogalacturonan acetylesterase [Phnomibacter sp.]|nr:rhamnogalacturonan acetylesterase [Phnomibacter sp.]
MNKWYLLSIIPFCLAFVLPGQGELRLFLAGDSTMSIKSTKSYPETGWGMPFVFFWNEQVEVVNRAQNGRSTKTFINEGLWKGITDELRPGDIVFIQFGHNDEVPTKRSYTPPDSFAMNLERFVNDTREKKGRPVLLTPVARRKFDDNGKPVDTHREYSFIIQQVANKLDVPCIDVNQRSMDLYTSMGVEGSKCLFLHLLPGDHPNYPNGKTDDTHFSELGARLIAQIVLHEIRSKVPALKEYIINSENK